MASFPEQSMASKPKPSRIPDVFARPGAAPARGRAVEDLPREVSAPTRPAADTAVVGGGLKASTVGTTLYLLPDESRRLKHLAVDLGLSVHELLLIGIDKVLAEHGQPPIRRYVPLAPRKEKKR